MKKGIANLSEEQVEFVTNLTKNFGDITDPSTILDLLTKFLNPDPQQIPAK